MKKEYKGKKPGEIKRTIDYLKYKLKEKICNTLPEKEINNWCKIIFEQNEVNFENLINNEFIESDKNYEILIEIVFMNIAISRILNIIVLFC